MSRTEMIKVATRGHLEAIGDCRVWGCACEPDRLSGGCSDAIVDAVDALVAAGCVPPDELIEAARDVIAPAEDALRYLTCDDRRFGMDPPPYLLYREVWDALRDALTRLQAAALAAAPGGQNRA